MASLVRCIARNALQGGLLLSLLWGYSSWAAVPLDSAAVARVFSGGERLHYAISWNGGITIGDLHIKVEKDPAGDQYSISANVRDYGLFRLFYPVDDRFLTRVSGPEKVPLRYFVHQKEGRGSEITRWYRYHQQEGRITYRKNRLPEEHFVVNGPVYNEFSSFFITRVLDLTAPQPFYIPTFADKQQHNVRVQVAQKKEIDSIYGAIQVVEVRPLLPFQGLYDKEGDTVIWFTEDACRVPVLMQSKIVVGFLRADLIGYRNPACPHYDYNHRQEP